MFANCKEKQNIPYFQIAYGLLDEVKMLNVLETQSTEWRKNVKDECENRLNLKRKILNKLKKQNKYFLNKIKKLENSDESIQWAKNRIKFKETIASNKLVIDALSQ